MVDCNSYKVQQGDTLSGIADWFNVSWKDLQRINGIDDPDQISVGQLLQLSTNRSVCTAYSVKEGDTLSQIGQRYGVRWTPLAHYNHIPDPDFIRVGQIVCI